MKVNDPAMLGSIETQMMASMLEYGTQFLDPLPADHKAQLAQELARDMHSAQDGPLTFDQSTVEQLTGHWFDRGRIYEILPEDALVATGELSRSATKLFLDRIPLQMAEDALEGLRQLTTARLAESPAVTDPQDAICRLFWAWFRWGRSYQKGNPPESQTLPS